MRARPPHAVPSAPWDALLRPHAEWDIEAMYTAHRGAPVSSTPCVHMVVPRYRESSDVVDLTEPSRAAIIRDLTSHGVDVMRSDWPGDVYVQRMRQRAVHMFLKSPATHLLWNDLDTEALDPTCVRKMLASGHDVVAGAYPFRDTSGRVTCAMWPGDQDALRAGGPLELPHGCLEVMGIGTGFMLVSRKALVATMLANPALLHWSANRGEVEPLFATYETGILDGSYVGEDYMFCHHWQRLGGKVYAHLPSTFRHYGTHGFEGSIMQQLGLKVAP